MRFKYTGYYFLGFLVFVTVGFWPTNFSKFFDGTADFTSNFHFPAVTALLWVLFLISQPMLVRSKRIQLHKLIGRTTYILVPFPFISIILLVYSRIDPDIEGLALRLWIPLKDLFIFTYGYVIAIIFRKSMLIHESLEKY